MAFIRRHRRCGCDARDVATFTQDAHLVSPSCCAVCGPNRDQKPPCCYVAHVPCQMVYQGELLTYDGQYIANGVNASQLSNSNFPTASQNNVFLRPICEFQNTCTFVSLKYSTNQPYSMGPYGGHNAACTWSERFEGQISQSTLNSLARWSLDISAKTLTHPCGIRYAMSTGAVWDCYGPNTMQLACPPTHLFGSPDCVDWQLQIPGLPKFVCVTPAISTRLPQEKCCSNCFTFDLPAGNAVHIPAQTVTFLPVQNINTTGGACGYEASLIDDGFPPAYGSSTERGDSSFTAAYLRVASPMNTGAPSQATLMIRFVATGAAGGVGSANYQCSLLTCDGGTFNRISGETTFPTTITLTAADCVWPENDNQGPCPAICITEARSDGGSDGSSGTQGGYISEAVRCACCDPFCDCIPGMLTIYCGTHITKLKSCDTTTTSFCKGGRTGVGSLGGPSREACFSVQDISGASHTICIVVYCSSAGAWQSDWYCDGSFQSTVGMVVTCCPLTAKADMPTMSCLPNCKGCVAINTTTDCTSDGCCAPADEPGTVHITFSSASCPAINGVSVPLTQPTAGGHYWANVGLYSAFYIFDLRCSGGIWTLGIHSDVPTAGCHVLVTSTDCVCKPVVSGTFGPIALPCVGPFCAVGNIVSAVLSP